MNETLVIMERDFAALYAGIGGRAPRFYHVVRPLFFPDGDIGSLAINGTVNDLAMCGACEILGFDPLYVANEGTVHRDGP